MSELELIKAERRKELLAILENKKIALQKHLEESASKSIDAGKGLLVIGTGVLLLYTVFDRFLESKFRVRTSQSINPSGKSSSNKILYPIFSMLLQQGSSVLFDEGQKRFVEYLKNKKTTNGDISGNIPFKE